MSAIVQSFDSQDSQSFFLKLYEKVKSGCIDYLKYMDGVCNIIVSDDKPLLHFLTGKSITRVLVRNGSRM